MPRRAPWLTQREVPFTLLGEWPVLIYNEDFSLYRQLLDAFDAAGIEPQIAVRSGQWDFLAAMVEAGIGLAVLQEPLCRRLDSQRLLWLPLMPQMLWQLGLIWRQNSYLSHGAQAWIVACCERWLPGERLRGTQQAPR